jgi:DNA-directed RNA polymerase subunit RPC12/RpoP
MSDEKSLSEKIMEKANEILEKSKCVRCGTNVAGGGPGVRCGACRKKLNAARQKVGSPERAANKAEQARRRETKGNGTATPKSKGKSKSNKELAASFQAAEKKAGEKLSPNRQNNSEGYGKANIEHVKEGLNIGRHEIDKKKLAEWKSKLKKSGLTTAELTALILSKVELSEDDSICSTTSEQE